MPERPTVRAGTGPLTKRVFALLEQDPTLRPADLSRALGCSEAGANKARRAYFLRHPEQEPTRLLTLKEQVIELLAQNPTLSPAELGRRLGCDPSLAGHGRTAYFAQHPEQKPAVDTTVTEHLYALLAENPAISTSELCARAGSGRTLACKVRRMYFHQHPEQEPVREPSATEQLETLLSKEPTLSATDLWTRLGCDPALAARVRRRYLLQHPEREQGNS